MRTPTWKAAAAAGAALLVLGLGACGDDEDEGTDDGGSETTETTAATDDGGGGGVAAASVTIRDFEFDPTELTAAVGDTISVTNEGSSTHTFTSDEAGFDVELGGGESGEATVAASSPGSYEFRCDIHTSMTGTITVE
jgi:plastocyanin